MIFTTHVQPICQPSTEMNKQVLPLFPQFLLAGFSTIFVIRFFHFRLSSAIPLAAFPLRQEVAKLIFFNFFVWIRALVLVVHRLCSYV